MAVAERDFGKPAAGRGPVPDFERWAVVVGISTYAYKSLNLEFAARDAERFVEVLKSPTGGAFEEDHICQLIDEQATTGALTRALRSFLKRPGRDDLVLLYFACHGTPDPDRPAQVYLVTHDTDPDDIAGTALPMQDVERALDQTLLAERVVILADTCHSGEIARGGHRGLDSARVVNTYMSGVSQAKPGVAVLASAEASEVSREGAKWGGGHGVFTHFLLEGMKGEADTAPRDGKVTVGELFEYVREKVREATEDKQHPSIGPGSFDRELPLAITAGLSAASSIALGRGLVDLGRRLDDREVLASAAGQLTEARRLAKAVGEEDPAALVELGLAWLAAGEADKAAAALQEASSAPAPPPDALFHLGMAHAKRGHPGEARAALGRFLEAHPKDARADWARALAESLETRSSGPRHALVIGVDQFGLPEMSPLQGVPNDVALVQETLRDVLGFPAEQIATLTGADATRARILEAFGSLEDVPADGLVFVYFTGHALDGDGFLVPYDIDTEDSSTTVSPAELDARMSALSAGDRLLVLDTNPNQQFVALAQAQQAYDVVLAASPGEMAYESWWGDAAHPGGAFTTPFMERLRDGGGREPLRDLIAATRGKLLERELPQTPLLIGDRDRTPFAGRLDLLRLCEFAQARNYSRYTRAELARRYADVAADAPAYGELRLSFARALLEKGDNQGAEAAARAALEQKAADAELLLARALLSRGRLDEASELLERLGTEPAREAAKSLRGAPGRRRALLIGVDRTPGAPEGDPQVIEDLRALRAALVARFEVGAGDVTLLYGASATADAIRGAVGQLTRDREGGPALLCVVGRLGRDRRGPLMLSSDGAQLPLTELVPPDESSDVVAIVDEVETPGAGGSAALASAGLQQIGQLAIYRGGEPLVRALVARAGEGAGDDLTYADWAPPDAPLRGLAGNISVLADVRTIIRAYAQFEHWDAKALRDTAFLLHQRIDQPSGRDPEAFLHRGLVRALLGQTAPAIRDFQRALTLMPNRPYPAAHFHIGRVKYESGDDYPGAVSELRRATEQDADRLAAWLYLGRALRAMVERETLAEAESALRRYLAGGAPLGDDDEVVAFLQSRRRE
jgi:tetratricopeptide (TPR) repeat protein